MIFTFRRSLPGNILLLVGMLVGVLGVLGVLGMSPSGLSAQVAAAARPYDVTIDGLAAGSAESVQWLTTASATVRKEEVTTTLPDSQIMAGHQGRVILTTRDPQLVLAIQNWMRVDNSGSKNTVQPKTVRISRSGVNPQDGYRLLGAWPVGMVSDNGVTSVTFVFQILAPVV